MYCSWNIFVDKESIVRLIDAFVNRLDIEKYGVKTVSVDGSKIQAANSKNNNSAKNKLYDITKWLNGHTDWYLRTMNRMYGM